MIINNLKLYLSMVSSAAISAAVSLSILTMIIVSAVKPAQAELSLSKIKVAMPFTVLVQRAALEGAVKAGDFKREGLDVTIVGFRSWTEPVQAIAANAAQFALGGGGFIRAAIGGRAPVRAIAMVSSRIPYLFWTKKTSGIKSIKDLRGKTIQTVRTGETLDNVWKEVLADAGLKISDVKRFESFNGFGALMSGNAQVANISSNFIGKARKAGLIQVLDYNTISGKSGVVAGSGQNLGWGTSLKMLKDHPDTVRAFLRALAKATQRLRNDRAFAVSVLTEKPYIQSEATAKEVWKMHKDAWMLRLDLSKGDYSFDVAMTEIALRKPKGSIDIKQASALKPIADVLQELNISFSSN
ncbi:MAG: ABC transporter substrate-binding protein [Rhodospirillales bacterium]|jgi:NitT/TauT family transport system substrate-binding protein